MKPSGVLTAGFLTGGGEMGNLMRSKDWSESPLGSAKSWPLGLRTAISLLLNSKFPMSLWWGTDLLCFYNDAYRSCFGELEKHSSIVGMPLKDSWPEVWHIVRPLIDQVFNGETVWKEDQLIPIYRRGKMEDVYCSFSYSPVYNGSGSVAGIFATGTETTEKFVSLNKAGIAANDTNGTAEAKHRPMENETQFRSMVMLSSVPMTILRGSDLIIEMANTAMMKDIWRKSGKDVIGKKVFDVFPELNDQKYREIFTRVFSTGEICREKEALTEIHGDKGMKRFYLDFECAPLFEIDGSISGIILTFNDVTEKTESNQAVEDAEARLRFAIEAANLATWDVVLDSLKVSYSPRLLEIFGYSSGTVLTIREMLGLIHPDDVEVAKAAYLTALEKGRFDQEVRIVKPDNTIAWVRIQGKLISDANNGPTGISGTLMDISEARISEENTAYLAAIIQSSEDAIVSKTLGGIVTSWNPAAEKLFGFTASEMIHESILKIIPPDRYNEEPVIIERIKRGEPIEHFDTKRLHKSGRLIDISLSISPVKDKRGNVIGASKIARDITDRVDAAKKIKESSERLKLTIEATHLGTWDYNPLTDELNWSEECRKIFGVPANVTVDKDFFSAHIHPDDKNLIESAIDQSMDPDGTGTYDISYRIRRFDDNSIRSIRVQGAVRFNEQLQVDRFIGTVLDITEQKRVQQALEEIEQRNRLAIDAADMGTFDWDLITDEFIGSPRLNHIFGYQGLSDIDHQRLIDAFLPEDRPVRDKAVNESRTRGSLSYEARIVWPDKSIHWVRVYGKIVYDEKQTALRMYGTVLDVTEEKTILTALEESENRFRLLANFMPQFVWTGDIKGNLNYFNDAVYNFTGLDKEKMPTGSWLQIVHPDDYEFTNNKWLFSVENGVDLSLEHRFKRKDGEYRWQLSRAIPFKGPDNGTQMWIGTSTDIHDQKSFNERLQKSELLFKTISNASPVGLWMTDEHAKNTFVNDTWILWTGVPLEKQYEEGWVDHVIDEDKLVTRSRFLECMRKRERYSGEFRIVRADGQLRWCLTEGSPYYDINGEYMGYAGSVTDITDRKMVEEDLEKKVAVRTHELNLANQALEKSNDELEEFAYVASHDLQEPLRKIKTFVSRLQETNGDMAGKPGAIYMDKIISATARMSDLISDLLEYSRITKISEQRVETDLNLVLKNVLEDFELMILQKNAVIKTTRLPVINAVPHQMNQLFSNLINNSLKFSMEGRPPVIVITSRNLSEEENSEHNLSRELLYNEIVLEDNGIGFGNEYSEKIFEIFQRLNARSSYSGWGIGLSICRKIVLNHNGMIFADSIEGEVTRFHVILPVENEKERPETTGHRTVKEP